jgi:hypothetical protein
VRGPPDRRTVPGSPSDLGSARDTPSSEGIYHFSPYTTGEILRFLRHLGFVDAGVLRLAPADFPANLTRIAVIARKA